MPIFKKVGVFMKLPNGYGSVYKLSGKRRNPYIARKTTGWLIDDKTGKAKQQYITIGLYPTRAAALQALADYNASPYDISANSITFSEVYAKWSESHFKEIVPSACRTWVSAYNHSKPLHNMPFKDIRTQHLEQTILNANVGQSTKQRMKSLYNMLYKYALKYDIVEKDYAALCDGVKAAKPEIVRVPFSSDEITLLWENIDLPFVDMVLIGIYSGFRPQELAVLQIENIDLQAGTMVGGLKTAAGRNRVVPIHSAIYDLVKKNYSAAVAASSPTLFNDANGQQGTQLTYDKYRGRFNKVCKRLGLNHKPHDTRHTFITKAKAAGVNEYMLKLIVGHAINDITEKTYTHRTIVELKQEIEKIK